MAFTLDTFTTPALTMDSFKGQATNGKTPNERTAKMLAASQAAIEGGQVETYQDTKARLLDPEQQDVFTLKQQQTRDAMWQEFVEPGMTDLLVDPNIPPEGKDQIVAAFDPTNVRMPLSTLSTLSYQAARADMDINATAAAEEASYKFIDSIDRVNNDKKKRQSAINSLGLMNDQGTLGTLVDVGELVTPFAEWLHIDHLQKELGSGDASWYETEEGFLLGEQKKALYERIHSMSMDERADFTDRVLDVIQNNKQVVLSDGNDVVALETLNRMLIDNDYSNTERWFDNITSVLDVIGLGGVARGFKITKGIEAEVRLGHEADAFVAANKAEDLGPIAKEAEEFMARPAEDLGPIAREAEGFQPSDDLAGGLGADARAFTPAKEDLGQMGREAAGFKGTPDPTAEDLFGAMAETTRTQVSPTSASQIVKDVNPTTAREMHKAVLADTTGEVSEGLYGANKVESLAKDILPEPDTRAGKMQNKVEMKPTYDEPDAVRRARLSNGLTYVSEKEIGSLKKRLVASFENVEGMALHASSLVVRTNLDQTIGITARYSPVDSGFESWADAGENAKFAFRRYGLQDDAFVPLVRRGEDWEEVNIFEVSPKDVDYAVGLKFDYRFRPEDLEVDEALTHTGGILARIAQFADEATSDAFARLGQGSITQNVLDPASVISPQIVEAGHVAVDRATGLKKIYQNLVKDFAEGYSKISKQRRQLMADYIHEANLDGIPLSVTELYNRGFTAKEIELLKEFRKSMDAMWYAANDDMVTSLRAKGVKVFTHSDSDTKLFGKPVGRNTVSERTVMYDAVKGTNVRNSKEELDSLYDVGGEVLRLDEPTQIDGQWVEHVLVRNTPSGGYTRGIYEGEVVMPYRDGYYPVMYDANYFIEKAIRMPDGTTRVKVVASAKDSKELAQAMKALRKAEPDSTFTSRKDRRLGEQGDIFDEGSWSHVTNAGMSSQRVRGERLGDAGTNLHKMGHNHLKDPLEAVANQIHNLSQRVSMRSYMETTKQRWMQNYAKHLDIKPNKFGQVEFPQSIGDIKGKETTPRRVLMDAKANFNYIHALQNGYINYIDETFKGLLHFGADMLGEIGWSKAQRGAFELAKGSPTRVAKQTAFKMLISLNPQRQVIVQRGQILQLAVPNPKYVTTGLAPDMSGIDFVRVGLSKNPKYVALLEEIKDAGILEAVDSHVLLRDRNMRLADMHWAQKVGKMVNAPIDFLERIGFAAAEQDVLISAYLTFRDLAVKAGKNIKDQRVRDEIMGQARAFTGGMNRAGDMAYSQNSLSMVAQFFSFRHKMLLQTVSNKSLTKTDRARLLAFNVALFGIDTALITYAVNKIFADSGKPSEGRDILNDGLIDVALNQALTMASGEEQAIDWGDLAPTEAYGMGNMFIGMWTTNLSDMIANSPAGSLWGGANPRVTDALRTAARYFSVIEDYEDPKLQTKLTDVATAFASLASGYSNTFKARYAAQMGKKMSTAGNISDADVTKWEAVAAGFGFQTKTEVGYRKTYEEIYGSDYAAGSDIEADVQSWYKELKRQLAKRGTTPLEDDMSMRVMSEAWRVFGEERPKAMDIIAKEIEKDARNKDYSMITTLTRKIGLATEEEMWAMINKLPDSGVRTQLTEIMNAREEMDSGN